jgi:hypothetical protein
VRTDHARPSGCGARKIPACGEVFFLDFSLYRTYLELRGKSTLCERQFGAPWPFKQSR